MSTCKPVEFTIYGEPASKSNSRRLVLLKGRPAFIKSKKALDYLKAFNAQCPTLDPLIEDDCAVEITIYYRTRRPDLDASVIYDALQKKIIKNDRQIKEMHLYHGLSKDNPRAEISITKKPPNKKKGG
tara:strand:+ start:3538 stop:3921 length:384 start_codon:yes stop_codon:yes gene_type:complete